MDEVGTELRRISRRWRELPESVAHENAGLVREFAQSLADSVRRLQGREPLAIPDLGAAVLLDQLTVMVYDACRADLREQVLDGLARLRRALP